MALNDPKLISRIKIAAAIPTIVANPSDACCACSIAWPPSSTWSVAERADSAVVITRSTADLGSAFARLSKLTVAKAIVPSREIACCAGGERADHAGHVRAAGRRLRVSRSDRARSAASVSLPVRAWKTIWSASPACAGKRLVSRLTACCEPVPGQREVAGGLLPDRARDREDPDRGDDPSDHDDPAVRHCPASDVQHLEPQLSRVAILQAMHLYTSRRQKSTLSAKFPCCEALLLNSR